MQNTQITHKAKDIDFGHSTFDSFSYKISRKNNEQMGKSKGRDKVRVKTTRCLEGVW